ncbi:hypothetical protein PSAC2689_60058 [Paraburkholderia sacchari]
MRMARRRLPDYAALRARAATVALARNELHRASGTAEPFAFAFALVLASVFAYDYRNPASSSDWKIIATMCSRRFWRQGNAQRIGACLQTSRTCVAAAGGQFELEF